MFLRCDPNRGFNSLHPIQILANYLLREVKLPLAMNLAEIPRVHRQASLFKELSDASLARGLALFDSTRNGLPEATRNGPVRRHVQEECGIFRILAAKDHPALNAVPD